MGNYDFKYFFDNWSISHNQCQKIVKFVELIFTTSTQFNLTGHKTKRKIFDQLIVGGIVPYAGMKNFINSCHAILDVGSGAGIPGILLKIFFPKISVFLLESSQKKCAFLRNTIGCLDLKKTFVLNQRAENLQSQYCKYFDFVTARALAKMSTCLKLMIPYLKFGGRIVLPKSDHSIDEYNQCKKILKSSHIKLIEIAKTSKIDSLFCYHTYVFTGINA